MLLTADGLSRMSAQTPEIAVSALQPGHAVAITSVLDANNLPGNTVAQHNVLTTAVLDDVRPRLSGTLAKALNAFEVLQVYAVHGSDAQLLGTATTNGLTLSLIHIS